MAPQSCLVRLNGSKIGLDAGKEVQENHPEITSPQFAWVNEDENLINKVTTCKPLTTRDP
jgi:hypothetical protein